MNHKKTMICFIKETQKKTVCGLTLEAKQNVKQSLEGDQCWLIIRGNWGVDLYVSDCTCGYYMAGEQGSNTGTGATNHKTNKQN